jgi:DNA mismatch endonuclease (patch repair protein)
MIENQEHKLRMSKIRQKDTTIEIKIRKALHARGFRYRLHQKNLPGRPDLVLARYKVVIFVHGCFWHYHQNCKHSKIPATNSEFWKNKLENNAARDLRQREILQEQGWRVLTIWGCALSSDFSSTVEIASNWIKMVGTEETPKEISNASLLLTT